MKELTDGLDRGDWEATQLEAELLKAVNGPHREMTLDALEERVESLIAARKPEK